MVFVSVNMHGQVTLPASLRKKLGIRPGSLLQVQQKEEKIELTSVTLLDKSILNRLSDLAEAKNISREDIARSLRKIRRENYAELYGN